MAPMFSAKKILVSLSMFALINPAQASIYTNVAATFDLINHLGAPDSTSYGQHFIAPSDSLLQDFTFYASEGERGNVSFVIAQWDGQKAVGPALFSQSNIFYNAGSQALGANNINLSLTSGHEYIAYLTTANQQSPLSNVFMKGSNNDGGLSGGFRYLNTNGADPLLSSTAWQSYSSPDLMYTASFTTPVPEPETYALLGMGLIVLLASRRKTFTNA
jgi:hypothetical protein